MKSPHVVIIGSGIIGLAVAIELFWRGAEVTLIDPRAPGSAASLGNTGWVVPALSAPIPAPGLPWQVAKWMFKPDSPFRLDLRQILHERAWLLRFLSHCNPIEFRNGLLEQGKLNAESYSGFQRWRDSGLEFEWGAPGVTFVSESTGQVDHILGELDLLADSGYQPGEKLDSEGIRSRHPELARTARYGVCALREQYVRPESVVHALVNALRERVNFVRGTADSAVFHGSVVEQVSVQGRTLDADAVVIASGAWSKATGRVFGVDLPILGGKGYSITVHDPDLRLSGPLYLAGARIACTPFEGANRFAGMMELTGIDDSIDPARVLTMTTALDRFLPGWSAGTKRTVWAGLRPMSPDGLPLIGKILPLNNVYAATGHGMLGVTMAPVTGEIIADLIVAGATPFDVTAFRVDRF